MKRLCIALLSAVLFLPAVHPTKAARLFANASSPCLQAANVDLSGVNKFTIAFWLYWDTFADTNLIIFELSANFNSNAGFVVNPNSSTSSQFEFALNGNVGIVRANFTRPSGAAWHHYVGVFDKSLSSNEIPAVYLDGVSQTLSYTGGSNNNTDNFINSTLNFGARNCASLFANGRLAEVAVWPGVVNLTQGEITSLAKGYSPALVRPSAKPYYWPLIGRDSPEPELFYRKTAAVTNATQTAHVRVFHSFRAQVTP